MKRLVVLLILCAGCAFQSPYEDPKNVGEMIAAIQQANPNARVLARTSKTKSIPQDDISGEDWFYQLFGWKVSADEGFAHHWFTIFELPIGCPRIRYDIIVINGTSRTQLEYTDSGDKTPLSPIISEEKDGKGK